ncbi:MAG: radical SAM protein, partial [Alphaproteobacteria bacterium]|nr:radical SAM protein [Alphaproteobacteria bacterium]
MSEAPPKPADTAFDTALARVKARGAIAPRVLLIELPQFLYESYNREVVEAGGCYAFPPVGLLFVKTVLEADGAATDVFDLNLAILTETKRDKTFTIADWPRLLDAALAKAEYGVVGLTCMSVLADTANPDFFMTGVTRRLRASGNYVIIGGGSLASAEYEYYLGEGLCDFVVSGEGELRSRWLMARLLDRPTGLAPQKGVYFRGEDGAAKEVAGRNDPIVLDHDVVGAYRDLDFTAYWAAGSLNPFSRMAGTPFGTVQLNRGCRANCAFCGLSDFMGRGVRQRQVDPVVRELRYLVEERGVRYIDILDDDFVGVFSVRSGLVAVLEELGRLNRKFGAQWAASNGLVASAIDESLVDVLANSGCLGFRLGVEAGNEQRLRQLRRPSNKFSLRRLSAFLPRLPEVFVCGNYIVGYFGAEPFGEMMETFRFATELKLDWNGFTAFQFTSQESGRRRADGTPAQDFVPTRRSSTRQFAAGNQAVSGPEVFLLPVDEVPSREQVGEVWFAFNLVVNYILNKNLAPEGRPDKYANWI